MLNFRKARPRQRIRKQDTLAERLHRAAERMEPTVRRRFLAAVESMRARLNLADLADLLESQPDPLRDLGVFEDLEREFGVDLRRALEDVVTDSASDTLDRMELTARVGFTVTNPHAVAAVDTVVRESLQRVTNSNRDGVRTAIRQAFTHGISPQETARSIRDAVGLTARQAGALENMRAAFEEQGIATDRARDQLESARRRMLADRAQTIARTETIRASAEGQLVAWQVAIDDGVLRPDTLLRRSFVTGDGSRVSAPPAHPRCRCALALRTTDAGRPVVVWVVTPDDRLCPICAPIPTHPANQIPGLGPVGQ